MAPAPIPTQVTLEQYEQMDGAKVDVTRLQQLARDEVGKLRERGRWDG